MKKAECNLLQVQHQLAAHIRNPAQECGPNGIEPRRLKIYRQLFYNNIENFISNSFPVLRQLIADEPWHALVRDFMVHHRCHSPYFLEISQEFLLYLQNTRSAQAIDLPFMLELAHYEWVELALDVADEDLTALGVDGKACSEKDYLQQLPVVSPLAWSLVYQYPVHLIGPNYQPESPAEQATYLVVYRNRDDQVGFMEINAVTARLLELLQLDEAESGAQVLKQLAIDLQHPEPEQVLLSGVEIIQQLRAADIILGCC